MLNLAINAQDLVKESILHSSLVGLKPSTKIGTFDQELQQKVT